jgi:hypothetical protein
VEDFTTMQYCDTLNTTAWWDTVAGEVKLPPFELTLAGSWDTPGSARDVAISGDYAYVADGSSGLQVIDITNPASPTLAGSYDTPGYARGVAVSGDYAYVADDLSGLQVIDITNPAIPTLAGSCDTPGYALGVAISGDYAYVADFTSGLQVIDISDPTTPTLEGSCDTPGDAFGVGISGDYVYVADFTSGLQAIDISDPTTPALEGSCDTPGNALGVTISGDYAYVADETLGLKVIDISDPTTPTLASSYDTPGNALGVTISGDYAYVADYGVGLQVIDISNPASPTLEGSCDTPGDARGVAISGDYAYVADGGSGLQVIDRSNPASPTPAGTCDTPGWARGVAVSGDYAYVADGGSGLQVIDISDPATPTIEGSCDTPDCAHGVAVSGDYAYVADYSSGLAVIEVFQRLYDAESNSARSLTVDEADEMITRARLNATYSDSIRWELSADGGSSWQAFLPGGAYQAFITPGSDLLWRSSHFYTGGGINPGCTGLQIEWLYRFALIDSVVDVPNDQGGWARIYFTRSGLDFADASAPIVSYYLWRRIDDGTLAARIKARAVSLYDAEGLPTLPESRPGLHWQGDAHQIVTLDERVFMVSQPSLGGSFPPGTWEVVGSVPALQQDTYIAALPTLGDSTDTGIVWSVHCVSAHTDTPSVWYVSPADSGYSIDNLAPAPPPNLRMTSPTELAWDEALEQDFDYFSVYGSSIPGLDTTATLIGYTIGMVMDVSGDVYAHYHVTATDFAGNEGDASSVENTYAGIADTEDLPTVFALSQSQPNPFTARTSIRFDLPEPGLVSLTVYDVGGRLVRTLTDQRWTAGRHSVVWHGDDEWGSPVASGVYMILMEAGDFTDTKKMMVLH